MSGWGIADTASEIEKIKAESADYLRGLNSCCLIDWNTYDKAFDFYMGLIDASYEQGKKDAEQRWIPVTERLPEEDDYKSCIECLDGAVWYFTENGTMGLGYYYESVKEWSTTNDLKTDGKVVAWMQLPEPYGGEQE